MTHPIFRRSAATFFLTIAAGFAQAADPAKPAVVPPQFQWVRTMDVDGFLQRDNQRGTVNQHLRVRLRYLDPDVNAFIGMQAGLDHFNRNLYIGNPDEGKNGNVLFDAGAHVGLVRGPHLWELDLLGVTVAGKLGPAVAVVGEHRLSARWSLYHRTQIDAFVGDAVWDADQGLRWTITRDWEVNAGYRWFTSLHQDRSGPHLGLTYRFQSPHIPYIFPAVG